MNRAIIAGCVIVGIAVMLSMSTLAPAYAATKVVDFKFQNFSFAFNTTECGGVKFDGKASGAVVVWDNGHSVITLRLTGNFEDASGNRVGNELSADAEINEPTGFPMVGQFNGISTCNGTGQTFNSHFGFTIDENGNLHPR